MVRYEVTKRSYEASLRDRRIWPTFSIPTAMSMQVHFMEIAWAPTDKNNYIPSVVRRVRNGEIQRTRVNYTRNYVKPERSLIKSQTKNLVAARVNALTSASAWARHGAQPKAASIVRCPYRFYFIERCSFFAQYIGMFHQNIKIETTDNYWKSLKTSQYLRI